MIDLNKIFFVNIGMGFFIIFIVVNSKVIYYFFLIKKWKESKK